jgi:hypothetical protein
MSQVETERAMVQPGAVFPSNPDAMPPQPIQSEQGDLVTELDKLEAVMSKLEDRLQAVLAEPTPHASPETTRAPYGSSDLGGWLAARTTFVEDLGRRLGRLIDRVEA